MEVRRYQPKYSNALQAPYLESSQNTFHQTDVDAFKLSDFDQGKKGEQIWGAVSYDKALGFYQTFGMAVEGSEFEKSVLRLTKCWFASLQLC